MQTQHSSPYTQFRRIWSKYTLGKIDIEFSHTPNGVWASTKKGWKTNFRNAWKGGCVWPHLCFDAIGRAMETKTSKGPRWKCIHSTHVLHPHSYSYAPRYRFEQHFYDARLLAAIAVVFFLCDRALLSIAFCLSASIFFFFYYFRFVFFFYLYKMINVYVYIVVRSRRKYIVKWSMYHLKNREKTIVRSEWFRIFRRERKVYKTKSIAKNFSNNRISCFLTYSHTAYCMMPNQKRYLQIYEVNTNFGRDEWKSLKWLV